MSLSKQWLEYSQCPWEGLFSFKERHAGQVYLSSDRSTSHLETYKHGKQIQKGQERRTNEDEDDEEEDEAEQTKNKNKKNNRKTLNTLCVIYADAW